MRRHLRLGYLVAIAACALACQTTTADRGEQLAPDGGGGTPDTNGTFDPDFGVPDPDGGGGFGFLAIKPTNAVVKIDLAPSSPVPGKVKYTAIYNVDGKETDATDKTTFSVDDPTLGTFSGSEFTSTTALPPGVLGKSTLVRGVPGNGLANITVIALRTSGTNRDFFFVVPYLKDPDPPKDILKFGTNIKQVDVAFVQDTTASMGGEIANLRDSLATPTTGIIAKLKLAIPNVGVAVARFDDFPVAPFGFPGGTGEAADKPYELLTEVTTNTAKAQSAVFALNAYRGGALPESNYEAQYQVLTGEGLTWTAPVAGSIPAHTPKAGTTGGVDFRAGSLPVVVQITDSSWFEKETYSAGTGGKLEPHSKADVIAAYDKIKAKFVGIHSVIEKTPGAGLDTPCTNYANASCDSAQGYKQAVDMAEATASVLTPASFKGCAAGKCCTGIGGAAIDPGAGGKCPLVYQVKSDGTGVAEGIVSAIQAISVGSSFDVTAVPSNDAANPAGADGKPVDATRFIKSIRAMDEGDAANGCPPAPAKDTDGDGVNDTFIGVIVGQPVCFEVNAKKNDFHEPTAQPQFFKAFIDVLGMPGAIKLDRREVLFLVPPKEPAIPK